MATSGNDSPESKGGPAPAQSQRIEESHAEFNANTEKIRKALNTAQANAQVLPEASANVQVCVVQSLCFVFLKSIQFGHAHVSVSSVRFFSFFAFAAVAEGIEGARCGAHSDLSLLLCC